MKQLKKYALICIPLIISCSTERHKSTLDIDVCVILMRDGAPICRCTTENDQMYSLTIEECADKKYNAFSPDDAAILYERLFNLTDELKSCLEGR